jgi:hypothetical protein
MNTVNAGQIPSCEWPDAKKPATFRNCYDQDGRVDNNLMEIAAKNRIEEIREQLDAVSGLTNKKRKALYHEADRLERRFNLGPYAPVAEVDDKRKEKRLKAEEEKLRWLGRKADKDNSQ